MPPPRPANRTETAVSRRALLSRAAIGAAASVIPFDYMVTGTSWLSDENFEVRLPRWDAGPTRVTVLSDIHVNSPDALGVSLDAADLAMGATCDLIVMPGDFVNHSDSLRLHNLRRFLAKFEAARCPVLATMGNHDYSVGNPQLLFAEFKKSPVRLLRNEIVDLGGISVAGLDDALVNLYRPDILVPGEHSASLLTLLHEPDFVDEMPSHVSLQISGHSHGGQVCLPFGVPLHTPVGAWKYYDGFYAKAKVPLFVTRGVGTTGVRCRLFCRPQVAHLTLSAA